LTGHAGQPAALVVGRATGSLGAAQGWGGRAPGRAVLYMGALVATAAPAVKGVDVLLFHPQAERSDFDLRGWNRQHRSGCSAYINELVVKGHPSRSGRSISTHSAWCKAT
jgi:hypothetical protein